MRSRDRYVISAVGRGHELGGMCGALAERLAGLERVAFWAESRLESCVAVLAAIESGVQAVALNPKLGRAELQHIVSDSRPQALQRLDA